MYFGRLLHDKFISEEDGTYVPECFILRTSEKSISLIGIECACASDGTVCKYFYNREKKFRRFPLPFTYWKFSEHLLQHKEDDCLNFLKDKDCHISLIVSPEHNGDTNLLNINNIILMNFFKKNFKQCDVHTCEQTSQADTEEDILELDELMSKKLEVLKNKLSNNI